MMQMNLPDTNLTTRNTGGKTEVFDPVRRKYVALTPEEWVRQHFISYLVTSRSVPKTLIAVEISLKYNRQVKRADILVYGKAGKPGMVVECKAPSVKITQDVFDQVALYNMTLNVPFLVVTNGLEHFACLIDKRNSTYAFLEEIPAWEQIVEKCMETQG
jgi:type I site-specific restriction endonuclease